MVADSVGGNTYLKDFMNGFAEAMKIVVYQTCHEGKEGRGKAVLSLAHLRTQQSFKMSMFHLTTSYFPTYFRMNVDSADLTKFD